MAWMLPSCAGEQVKGRVAGVQTVLQRAIQDGSKTIGCAPKETALAEANIKFSEDALKMGELFRGKYHAELAEKYAKLAQAKTDPVKCRDPGAVALPPLDPAVDRDQDGYDDKADKCPDDPEDFDGFEDEDGCPDKDNDGDGVLDASEVVNGRWVNLDRKGDRDCRNEPEDKDGFEDEDGCPDLDNDKDGIPDLKDQCPNDPEDFDGDQDEDGCPDLAAKWDGCQLKIDDKIYFKFGKWDIDPKSYGLLNDVGKALNEGENKKVSIEIGGHTDDVGSDKSNLKLSQRRVDSVLDYLAGHGVERSRMTAVGYGERQPIDTNRTSEGRANNRRVEFRRTDGECKK